MPLVLRVDYPGFPQVFRDATENLSAGGLFIRSDRALSPGDRVPLQVSFPGLLEPLEIEVEVVRRRPPGPSEPAGVAVRIPDDRTEDRAKLARLAASASAPASAPARGERSYRIVVAEDNPHVVEMYEYALRKLRTGEHPLDVAVEFALNGHEALTLMRSGARTDLVLTDLYMPVMDGFTLVERMHADPELMETPVVVISAGGPDARARATELGVEVYLQKPVQFVDIIQTVRSLLRLEG